MRLKFFIISLLVSTMLLGAVPSALLKTMRKELDRSMSDLSLEGEKKPYFISYLLVDRCKYSASAKFGALMDSSDTHSRFLNVQVRVGDYRFDNMPSADQIYDYAPEDNKANEEYKKVPIPLAEDSALLSRALWLMTDIRYKQALRQYAKKEGRRATEVEEECSDDFDRQNPVSYIGEEVRLTVDRSKWEQKIRQYSSIFADYPEIQESKVSFSVEARNNYFCSTEGSEIQEGKLYCWLRIIASTQADDGMWVQSYRNYFGWSVEELPSDDSVRKEIAMLVNEVLALKNAPVMEAYVGPALIESRAAGVFIHETYGHRLESHRIESRESGETFKDKVGSRILPAFLSLYDDPTIKDYKGKPLNGFYLYDDEGVASRRVTLISNGVLENFLCSRKPIKAFPYSNGHGRAQMEYIGWGGIPVPRQGNLILENSRPVPFEQLKKQLLAECRKQRKPYGLIFVRSEGGATNTSRGFMELFQSNPLLVYRVDVKTGKEELVRGIKFGGTPLAALNKIMAAGDDPEVFNGFCGAESGSVPVGLVSPSILLSEIEIAKDAASNRKPPILPSPLYPSLPQDDGKDRSEPDL